MTLKKHIPNIITLLNLFCGCIALIFAVNGDFIMASLFTFLGIFFDFFDGFFARKLNVQSPLGLQLDSLADMVTSGVVPGVIMYKLLGGGLSDEVYSLNSIIPYIGLFIPLASAYRLAKFNLDEDQQSYFKGLPVPANTLLIFSLPLILEYPSSDTIEHIIRNKWFLIGLTFLSCYLLNAKVKLFALKFKDWSFKTNTMRYGFLIVSVLALIFLKFIAIPLVIILYILLSFFNQKNIN